MKIRSKLILSGLLATLIPLTIVATVAIRQASQAEAVASEEISSLAMENNERILAGVVAMVTSQQEVLEQKVIADLNVARDVLARTGEVRFAEETVDWQAVNQGTGQRTTVSLPRMLAGDTWLGQNASLSVRSPVVDEVRDLVGGTATVFQRMNAAGDMLRVSTNVATLDDTRAIGTFIPARNTAGETNRVVQTVLDGRRFVGRAFVVNAWYITAYEPIRDAAGEVVGMLYTGVAEQSAASLRRQIIETTVGDTGYVYVLDSSGTYIISQNGERDGELIIDAVDAEGRSFVRDIIAKATDLRAGEFATERYPWQNPGDPAPRMKTVSIAYFAPWDWVIAAGTYDEEFMAGLRLIEEVDARGRTMMFAVLVVSVVFVVVLWLRLGSRLSAPIVQAVGFAKRISLGELDIALDVNQKDEIGVLADALRGMLESLRYKADLVKRIAAGDLTVDVNVASEKDGLGKSLVTMVESLNDIIGRVQIAVEQVTAGAGEVANASQQLSQGATESASSVEEISASINEMNGQTAQSAQSASEASELSRKAADDATAGQARMGELRGSMESISEASGTIRKVVKLIDDIAFQIKVLALNANVEAARAGKYGKGFAVVAEEVGNLAARSAAAVRETTAMVDQSEASITAGGSLTVKTAEQLDAIVTGTIRVAEVLEEIAAASKEQAQGIEQIAEGLGQVDDVTQSNTASAEQSAAASEELAAQAQELQRAIATFRLREEGRGQALAALPSPR